MGHPAEALEQRLVVAVAPVAVPGVEARRWHESEKVRAHSGTYTLLLRC